MENQDTEDSSEGDSLCVGCEQVPHFLERRDCKEFTVHSRTREDIADHKLSNTYPN